MRMEPANSIIKLLGGPKVVASIVGKHPSRIYRWAYPETTREGTGGLIPSKDAKALLEHAQANDIDLQPGDFFSPIRLQQKTAMLAEAQS